jgi:hypothetical protein
VIDLLSIFAEFDAGSSHHRAAIIELQNQMPPELLDRNADWVDIFEARESEEKMLLGLPKIEE